MDFWLSSKDLPRPENRVFYDGEWVILDVQENNMEVHHRLRKKESANLEIDGTSISEHNQTVGGGAAISRLALSEKDHKGAA